MFNYIEGADIKIGKLTLHVTLLIIILSVFFSSFRIVTAGKRGVKLTFGKPSDVVVGEGLALKIPFVQSIQVISVQTQKNETKAMAYSNDIQTVDSGVALNYHVNPDAVINIYRQVQMEWEQRIIAPAIQEAVKATTAKFKAQELIEQRDKVKDEIKTVLFERLSKWGIVIDEFSIINFDFSDQYEKAVEEKQVAQQNALKSKNDLERVKLEAEQRIEQAKAEAEAIKISAQAIQNQGGAEYVRLKAVEKWNGVLPTQMIPDATLPFINVNR